MKWIDIRIEVEAAATQIEGILNRTVKVCEHIESLISELQTLKMEEAGIVLETQKNLKILDQLASIEDKGNIPIEMVLRATEIFLRAQYVLQILTKAQELTSGPVKCSVEVPIPPNRVLH
jgi:hypothetical protein